MKLKVKITGPKVHDIGYRFFLAKLAMTLALPGFTAYNWVAGNHQEVIALIEGDPARIAAFKTQVEGRKPEQADVSSINLRSTMGRGAHQRIRHFSLLQAI